MLKQIGIWYKLKNKGDCFINGEQFYRQEGDVRMAKWKQQDDREIEEWEKRATVCNLEIFIRGNKCSRV